MTLCTNALSIVRVAITTHDGGSCLDAEREIYVAPGEQPLSSDVVSSVGGALKNAPETEVIADVPAKRFAEIPGEREREMVEMLHIFWFAEW